MKQSEKNLKTLGRFGLYLYLCIAFLIGEVLLLHVNSTGRRWSPLFYVPLGAWKYQRELVANENLDNLTQTGLYNCGATTSNSIDHPGKSAGFGSGFVIEVFLASSMGTPTTGYTKQRISYIANGGSSDAAIYERIRSTSAWTGWQRTDNFGTSSLGELASALGGLQNMCNLIFAKIPLLSNGSDVTSNENPAIFYTSGQSTYINSPFAASSQNYAIYVRFGSANKYLIIAYTPNGGSVAYIGCCYDAWQGWKKVTLE